MVRLAVVFFFPFDLQIMLLRFLKVKDVSGILKICLYSNAYNGDFPEFNFEQFN